MGEIADDSEDNDEREGGDPPDTVQARHARGFHDDLPHGHS